MDLAELPSIADGDWIVVVDVSDTTQSPEGTTKRVRKDLLKGVNWQGAWVAGTYVSDDGVSHNGSSWIATTTTTEEPSILATDWDVLAIKGDTGPTGPQGIQGIQGIQGDKGNQWQGAWAAGTYQIDDVVEHNGSSWIAIAVTTQEPSDIATHWDLFARKGTDGLGAGDMLKATYDPANKQLDAFEMDNMDEGANTKILTSAERAKIAFLTVTQGVNLDQMETDIAALANGMVYKGNWDASAGTFPGAGVAEIGWFYTVSVGGTVNGVVFAASDRLIAIVDNASTTTFASNWTKLDATDDVQSVAGLIGTITAAALRTAMNVGEIIDEDNMASNDATKVPSQQSVKAYVDSNPANLVALTANEALTAGQPVGISNIIGGIARALRSAIANAHGGTAVQVQTGGNNAICPIGGDKQVILLDSTNASGTLYAQVVTTNPATGAITLGAIATVGTALTGDASNARATVCKLDTDKFIVIYLADASTTAIQYRVGTVSGTTISWGTAATLRNAATTVVTSASFWADQIGTDKGIFVYGSAGEGCTALAFTVSSTTATSGTALAVNGNIIANGTVAVKKIATDKFVVVGHGQSPTTEFWAQVGTLSGTTITLGTADLLGTGKNAGQARTVLSVVNHITDGFVVQYQGSGGLMELMAATVSGTTISNGAGVVISGAIAATSGGLWAENSTTFYSFSGANVWKATLSGTTITAVSGSQANRISFTSSGTALGCTMFGVTDNGTPTMHQVDATNVTSWMLGLSNNYIGFVQNSPAAAASANVLIGGSDSNQSNLMTGYSYLVSNGTLSLLADNTTINTLDDLHIVKAISATRIVF
jgi:hypothetical protein